MRKHNVKIYHLPLNVTTGVPVSVSQVKRPANLTSLQMEDLQFQTLIDVLRNKICKGRFDPAFLRAIINIEGKNEYFVDADGKVLHRKEQYYISPGSFLWLYIFLESQRRSGK